MTHPACGHRFTGDVCPVCLLTQPLPAIHFGPFILEDELGRGGMGVVYRARDTRIDRACAVKLLDHAREGKALARVNHPNIVTLYEAGVIDDQPYIAMELVEGRSLRHTAADPLSVCIDVCRALVGAHAAGVIHGDIKPDNVLIDRDGHAKLGDFGIARMSGSTGSVQGASGLTGIVAGTPQYLAPELRGGSPATPRSDLYALGTMLAELCAPLKWPLDQVHKRLTAQDPAQRYANADEALDALGHAKSAMQAGMLPPEELTWLRSVALVFAAASGLALWALLQSISPVIVTPGNDVYALVKSITRTLADGRVVSYARLEIGPTLAAIAAFAIAAAAYGLLRQHWRKHGLEDPRPNRPLKQARTVFALSLACVALFLLRRYLLPSDVALYVPVAGGLLELLILYVLWTGLLEAARTSRSVTKEWLMWAGFWLALTPPAIELFTYVRNL